MAINLPNVAGNYLEGKQAKATLDFTTEQIRSSQERAKLAQQEFAAKQKQEQFQTAFNSLAPKYNVLAKDPNVSQEQIDLTVAQDIADNPILAERLGNNFRVLKGSDFGSMKIEKILTVSEDDISDLNTSLGKDLGLKVGDEYVHTIDTATGKATLKSTKLNDSLTKQGVKKEKKQSDDLLESTQAEAEARIQQLMKNPPIVDSKNINKLKKEFDEAGKILKSVDNLLKDSDPADRRRLKVKIAELRARLQESMAAANLGPLGGRIGARDERDVMEKAKRGELQ